MSFQADINSSVGTLLSVAGTHKIKETTEATKDIKNITSKTTQERLDEFRDNIIKHQNKKYNTLNSQYKNLETVHNATVDEFDEYKSYADPIVKKHEQQLKQEQEQREFYSDNKFLDALFTADKQMTNKVGIKEYTKSQFNSLKEKRFKSGDYDVTKLKGGNK